MRPSETIGTCETKGHPVKPNETSESKRAHPGTGRNGNGVKRTGKDNGNGNGREKMGAMSWEGKTRHNRLGYVSKRACGRSTSTVRIVLPYFERGEMPSMTKKRIPFRTLFPHGESFYSLEVEEERREERDK